MTFKVISLFSGIGGLDLGFERAGFEIVAQVETDKFCRKVLRKHWPNVALYEDVRHVGKQNLPDADVIMGGFPCQDISLAGKRQGIKEGTRSGLWLEFARIIGELRPRIVLLENVSAITTLDGATVIADLAALGYDAEWGIVAASDVGAPHRRERWFCLGYALGAGLAQREGIGGNDGEECAPAERTGRDVADAASAGLQRPIQSSQFTANCIKNQPDVESRMGRIFDGLPGWLDDIRRQSRWPARPGEAQAEWEAPRTVTEKVKDRANRIKALGNAVVPQVAYAMALVVRAFLEKAEAS